MLTWSDEFNGSDGSAVDSTKWVYDTGGSGWGNSELEYYTSGTANAVQQGGNLVITATTASASSYTCSYPSNGPCHYTSARLKTLGKFSQQYGRFEARIQMPEGQGIWPAFWMMGDNINTVNWPACGEIDVMENIGKEPTINHGSMHMPASGSTSDDQLTGMYTLSGGAKLGDAFHTYAIEWTSSQVAFYVDDMLYETQTKAGGDRSHLGVRPSVLHPSERRRRRHLAGIARLHDDLPADHEGRLGPRVSARELGCPRRRH